jgi:hypothetical protein
MAARKVVDQVAAMRSKVVAVEVADPPEAWTAAGFHVEPDGTCQVGSITFNLTPGSGAWEDERRGVLSLTVETDTSAAAPSVCTQESEWRRAACRPVEDGRARCVSASKVFSVTASCAPTIAVTDTAWLLQRCLRWPMAWATP